MIQKLTTTIDSVLRLIKSVSLFVILLVGVCIIGSSVGFSFFVPLKIPAVLLASAGSIFGTAVICLILPKVTELLVEQRELGLRETIRKEFDQAQKLAESEKEKEVLARRLAETEQKRESLVHELDRHKNMRIQINEWNPVFKVLFGDIDVSITDFPGIKQVGFQEGKTFDLPLIGQVQYKDNVSQEYVGVFKTNLKIHLGINFEILRIWEDSSGKLTVSGLGKAELQIPELPSHDDFLLSEIRTKKFSNPESINSYSIDSNDKRRDALTKNQRNEVFARIRNGAELSGYKKLLKDASRETIARLLSPLGKSVVFTEDSHDESQSLLDFLYHTNSQIEARIEETKHKLNLLPPSAERK